MILYIHNQFTFKCGYENTLYVNAKVNHNGYIMNEVVLITFVYQSAVDFIAKNPLTTCIEACNKHIHNIKRLESNNNHDFPVYARFDKSLQFLQ